MKVTVVTGIFPPDVGGPASYVPQIASELSRQGHTVTVLTLSDIPANSEPYPFRVVRLPRRTFKPWRWIRTIATIIRLGRRADMIFVNGLALEATVSNLLLRKPMVQKVVGDLAWEQATNRSWTRESFEGFQIRRQGLRAEALKKMRAWWTQRADRIIVPSRYLGRWVEGWGVPKEKINVIYNSVESPGDIVPAVMPLKTPVKVVTVGRLVRWKNVDKIIEAVARLDGIGLIIIGDGPENRSLKNLSENLGVSDRIYFAGARSRAETRAIMEACDIFILNSTYEGLPHVVLEAMSHGLAVIATAAGGTPEIVKDKQNGLLIGTSNEELSKALEYMANNKILQRRFAEQGRKTARDFSFPVMMERTEEVLDKTFRNKEGEV